MRLEILSAAFTPTNPVLPTVGVLVYYLFDFMANHKADWLVYSSRKFDDLLLG